VGRAETPDEALRNAAELFLSKHPEYGSSWQAVSHTMHSLFPDGVKLETPAEFGRYNCIQMIVSKLKRYCNNFETGGHLDSIQDLQAYGGMLEVRTDEQG